MRGPQGAGSGLLVGLAVAGGQRFSHGCGGAVRGVGGPAQGELQGGTLREALKGGQTLRTEAQHRRVFLRPGEGAASTPPLPSDTHAPFHPGWSPTSPSSCSRDTPRSPAWTPRTPRPAAAAVCTTTRRDHWAPLTPTVLRLRVCASPVFIKDGHLSHKRGFSLLQQRGAPPLPVHSFLCKI